MKEVGVSSVYSCPYPYSYSYPYTIPIYSSYHTIPYHTIPGMSQHRQGVLGRYISLYVLPTQYEVPPLARLSLVDPATRFAKWPLPLPLHSPRLSLVLCGSHSVIVIHRPRLKLPLLRKYKHHSKSLPTSHLPPPTSHLLPPTSHLPPPTSNFQLPTLHIPCTLCENDLPFLTSDAFRCCM
jgi:hypothetical protein